MEGAGYPGGSTENVVVPPIEGVSGGGTSYGWSDGGLQFSKLPNRMVDPTKVPTSDLLHVWCLPSTANVGQQEMPRQLEPISFLVARNERESAQISLRPKVSWGGPGVGGVVQVQISDLCSNSGDRLVAGESLTLRHVVPVLGVPDALVPLDLPVTLINVLPGETSTLWLSVDVAVEQSPGQYEGEIIITAMKSESEACKTDLQQIRSDLVHCTSLMEHLEAKPMEEVLKRVQATSATLKKILQMPAFSEFSADSGSVDIMDEDISTNFSVHIKLNVTVWDFVLPMTPSLPAVFGVSETVIEDRFGVEHGSDDWYDALERHFKWLLQYRISPFFCRWGENMRILAYTCPWPADHPKSEEYYSDPRLAAYAVPYAPILSCSDAAKDTLRKEVENLKTKPHWRNSYFYLWDEPLNLQQYEAIRRMSTEIRSYAPDARVLTTYYAGPSDAPLAPGTFEAFVKVPSLLRPHTQIFCTSEWVLGNREDLVKDITSELQPENGEEWWTYVCMGPSDPHPNWHLGMRGTQHRAVMWRVWKEGATGFLYWGANCYERAMVPNAEIRFRRGLPPGDGVLFYPGEVFSSSSQPVASARLERILSGLQDIEYLRLYTSRYGRDEALALLEKTGVYLGPERYTLDHMPIDVMRAEIFRSCRS
ncbi:uncharacterized protein LOC116252613 isoform X2 [Nymphaea colorata]|uniref:uncharacterized protein LOC116252613 isoform X2 n=1 Tax=Nymphaea colorata TaxID=210225 RepID=UPI00129EBEC3|nr:uncharacterized protein LOC116252613 isoform X2 [Nymphaea colorata]